MLGLAITKPACGESATWDEMETPGERGRSSYQCLMTLNAVGTIFAKRRDFGIDASCSMYVSTVMVNFEKVEDQTSQPEGVEDRGELHAKGGEDDDQLSGGFVARVGWKTTRLCIVLCQWGGMQSPSDGGAGL